MFTLLFTSTLLFAVIVFAIYLWQRPSSKESSERILPPRHAGLFGDEVAERAREEQALLTQKETEAWRKEILAHAAQGNKEALNEAHAERDTALYDEALNVLVERAADSDKGLLALASYITRHEQLRVNTRLAEALIEAWKVSPDKPSTAKMLHIAALSDDAKVYQKAVETAHQFLLEGRIDQFSLEELRVLADGEYWILSQKTRSSGAGFVLKRLLATLRK
ncbi:MAG: hypothetical protein WCB68_03495 [Pyrinomonadaceae bacterium]